MRAQRDTLDNTATVLVLVGAAIFFGALWWLKGIEITALAFGFVVMVLGFRVLRDD